MATSMFRIVLKCAVYGQPRKRWRCVVAVSLAWRVATGCFVKLLPCRSGFTIYHQNNFSILSFPMFYGTKVTKTPKSTPLLNVPAQIDRA